jgi:hypothetical protein
MGQPLHQQLQQLTLVRPQHYLQVRICSRRNPIVGVSDVCLRIFPCDFYLTQERRVVSIGEGSNHRSTKARPHT